MAEESVVLHASAVALDGQGMLICGASGSGKSALALELMARGADLIADDRTILTRDGDAIRLDAPATIRGLIEARGMGILTANSVSAARLRVVVDLDREETERLPPRRSVSLLSLQVPLLHKLSHPHFAAALAQYLKGGRKE